MDDRCPTIAYVLSPADCHVDSLKATNMTSFKLFELMSHQAAADFIVSDATPTFGMNDGLIAGIEN